MTDSVVQYGVRHADGRVLSFNSFDAAVTGAAYERDCVVVYRAFDGNWVEI
jgi:hypothetical protein